jgi:ATP-dependent Lon protease
MSNQKNEIKNQKNEKKQKKLTIVEELKPSDLRWTCPEELFKFKSTSELESLDCIVGQPRALEAIRLGAELFSQGYNIFVSGLSGTGRLTTVKKILQELTSHRPALFDYCYVNNFADPDTPRLIKLQNGKGIEFREAMEDALKDLRRSLPKLFQGKAFQKSRQKIIDSYQQRERALLDEFDAKIEPQGFDRGTYETEEGASQQEVFLLIGEKAVPIDQIDKLVEEEKMTAEEAEQKKSLYKKYHAEIFEMARKGMKIIRDFRKRLLANDKDSARNEVDAALIDIKERFGHDGISEYLDEACGHILKNLSLFIKSEKAANDGGELETGGNSPAAFNVFKVNLVIDNSGRSDPPVIVERTPSYHNIFGAIERIIDHRGLRTTDFTKIKAGALLRADQGYLIVNADDLFSEQGVWQALKRVLLYNKLEIRNADTMFGGAQSMIKPEPIDVNVKVIIIGGQSLYRSLYQYEKGFKKIFKVNAQFDYETDRGEEMISSYAKFIAKICREENLPHCSPSGTAAILEWAARRAGSKKRLTLKFSDVADILREAAFYDKGKRSKYINRGCVEKAIAQRIARNNMSDGKIKRSIMENSTMIDTNGSRTGQINGLTVYDTGILSFGKPARITAAISAGSSGIINIEREAELSGEIHNKGILIISGFLREKFAQKKSLSLTASIAFEQSYGGIDGDSASAAEIYSLLSAIAAAPIDQGFAITGSVNQKGDIQPIGGVNDKLTGYFEICKERGLTGSQGAIIPAQNVSDLMLGNEIIEAVEEGAFHIYPIRSIDEGIPILMGKEAGKLNAKGKYPKKSIYGRTMARLDELREYEEEGKKK